MLIKKAGLCREEHRAFRWSHPIHRPTSLNCHSFETSSVPQVMSLKMQRLMKLGAVALVETSLSDY